MCIIGARNTQCAPVVGLATLGSRENAGHCVLDLKMMVEVMQLFASLHKEGITVVLVTHEPDVAKWARRVLVMKDGLLVSDTVQEPLQGAA